TPSGASKHKPPGWTSPSGRHYPSEHQDWEPPHLPHHTLATEDPGQNPYQDPESKQPPDPFPEWHSFVAGHALPAMDTALDTDDKFWAEPLDDPQAEGFLLQCA
ncbi:hypothetical protein ABIB51_003445, partial [Arthrobacter sp. UYCu712]